MIFSMRLMRIFIIQHPVTSIEYQLVSDKEPSQGNTVTYPKKIFSGPLFNNTQMSGVARLETTLRNTTFFLT